MYRNIADKRRVIYNAWTFLVFLYRQFKTIPNSCIFKRCRWIVAECKNWSRANSFHPSFHLLLVVESRYFRANLSEMRIQQKQQTKVDILFSFFKPNVEVKFSKVSNLTTSEFSYLKTDYKKLESKVYFKVTKSGLIRYGFVVWK